MEKKYLDYFRRKKRFSIPELQVEFSLYYEEARKIVKDAERNDVIKAEDDLFSYVYKEKTPPKRVDPRLQEIRDEMEMPPIYRQAVKFFSENKIVTPASLEKSLEIEHNRAILICDWLRDLGKMKPGGALVPDFSLDREDYFILFSDDCTFNRFFYGEADEDESDEEDGSEDLSAEDEGADDDWGEDTNEDDDDWVEDDEDYIDESQFDEPLSLLQHKGRRWKLLRLWRSIGGYDEDEDDEDDYDDDDYDDESSDKDYAVYAIDSRFFEVQKYGFDPIYKMLGKKTEDSQKCFDRLPCIVYEKATRLHACELASILRNLNILAFVVWIDPNGNIGNEGYNTKRTFENECMDTIEWIVRLDEEGTETTAIKITGDILEFIKGKAPKIIEDILTRVKHEFEIVTSKEYDRLRKKLFDI